MNKLINLLGFLMVTMLAAFALPAIGQPTKTYHFVVEPGDLPKQGIAYVTNLSIPAPSGGGGTANIGSVILAVDNAGGAGLLISPSNVVLKRIDANGIETPLNATVNTYPVPGQMASPRISITGISVPLKGLETLKATMSDLGCGFGSTWDPNQQHVFASGNLTGEEFTPDDVAPIPLDLTCGDIACGASFAVVRADDTETNGTLKASATVNVDRGPHNADGSCTSTQDPRPFYITNRLGFSDSPITWKRKSVELTWIDFSNEVFAFDANIAASAPTFAWANYINSETLSETPAFLSLLTNTALNCSDPNSPFNDRFSRRYGVLADNVLPGATKFKVSTTGKEVNWPTKFPANFVIGDDLHVVIKISGSTWWLQSPVGPGYSKDSYVVYTPLNKLTATTGSDKVLCVDPSTGVPLPSTASTGVPSQENCPYKIGDTAKWCQIPGTGVPPIPYKFVGNGDPVFSGGE